jgi:branched-chain amino acid transport system substrate-binding protein
LTRRLGNKPKGLAEETKKRLNQRGIAEAIFEAIEPGKVDYWDVVQKMQMMGVEVLYFGGHPHEAGLIIRQAREHGYELELVGGDALVLEDFALIAGPASDGTLMTSPPEPLNPKAAEFAAKATGSLRASFEIYAALQGWAQAVEKAGTIAMEAVAEALRSHEFHTVLGMIGFDGKGDVIGHETFVWYVWKKGKYAPADRASHRVRDGGQSRSDRSGHSPHGPVVKLLPTFGSLGYAGDAPCRSGPSALTAPRFPLVTQHGGRLV